MSDFWLYFKLGLQHVLDWQAYDHVLFLIVLCASYTFASWKRLLILITLFTVGHTTSLLLGNYDIVSVSGAWIEFLIPVTILVGAIYNIITARKGDVSEKRGLLYLVTIFFGLIHGFGFSSFFKAVNDESALLPLLEFALGIELAQIIVALIVLVVAHLTQSLIRFNKRDWILIISAVVIGMVIPMLIENWIF